MFGFLRLLTSKPSKAAFATMIIKEARKAGVAGEFTYNEKAFTLQRDTNLIYLGNIHAEYCHVKDRDQRNRIIANLITPLLRTGESILLEEAMKRAFAVVREHAMFSFATLYWELDNLREGATAATESLSEWYCKAIVLDFPGHVQIVNVEDLERWNISFDELFATGLSNLDSYTTPKFRQENGYFVGTWKDDYDNSRVLLPGLFEDLPIEGEPVFVTPNRLTLMVADSKNESAVQAMLKRAEEITASEPRPHNPGPLCYRDGEFKDYSVPCYSPSFNQVERARKISALDYYNEQTKTLNELYEKNGKDFFVGKHQLIEKDDGSYFSWAVWSKGVRTLLPKADVIMFFDADKPEGNQLVARGAWEQVLAVAGDLMLDTEMFPPRYYVSQFPTEEQLRIISASASA